MSSTSRHGKEGKSAAIAASGLNPSAVAGEDRNPHLTVGDFRVHPSALAVPASAGPHSITGATAAEQMAAIAASDQGSRNSHDNTRPLSASDKAFRRLSDFISRSLPVILIGMVGYIYYVYVFRVCIRYYIDRKDEQTLAAIYLCVFNVLVFLFLVSYARSLARSPGTALKPPVRKPTPPIPTLTTPYQPQRVPSNLSQVSLASRSSHNSMPSNTLPAHPAASGINPSYPSYQATAPCNSQDTTAVSSPQDPVAPKLDHADIVITVPDDDDVQASSSANCVGDTAPESGAAGGSNGAPTPIGGTSSSQEGVDSSPIATLNVSKRDGRPRWCDICKIVKPDRCHHCSECDQCVLRMDHHCPWVNGCVGYNNYKFFYLFIFYGSLAAVFVVCTMIPLLVSVIRASAQRDREKEWWSNISANNTSAGLMENWSTTKWNTTQHDRWLANRREREVLLDAFEVQWVIISVLSLLLALLIVSFTAMHTSYILTNRTTIESLQDVRATFIKVLYKRSPTEAFLSSLDQSSYFLNQQDRLVGMPLLLPSSMHGPSAQILFNVVKLEPGERLWDQGSWLANWNSIMGPTWWLWFVPYGNTPGDGIHDVYSEKVYRRLVSDALAQARMQLANIGGLGDNGAGRGARPGRDGRYSTYGSSKRGQSGSRDKNYPSHSGGTSGRGSSNNSRTDPIGSNKGEASTGQSASNVQQQLREKWTVDHARMLSSSQFTHHHHHVPSNVDATKRCRLESTNDTTHAHKPTPRRPANPYSSSEPSSHNPSRSPSPDGRAGRATTGTRRTLKRMGTAPSMLNPSTIRFQNNQDGAGNPRQHLQQVEACTTDASRWAAAEEARRQASDHSSSSSPVPYLAPSSAKSIPAGPKRHARQRTLSSSRSQGSTSAGRGPSSSTFGGDFLSGGFGMGIDGDGIAVNSSMALRFTADDQRSGGGRSSPSSSRKGHRRHHSARGSSDAHHHHHHHHHHHSNHPRTPIRTFGDPPISPDSDDAFPPPVPAIPRSVGTSSNDSPSSLPRSQSHGPQRPIAPLDRHPFSNDSPSLDPMSKGKAVKGQKERAGRQRYRTVDGSTTIATSTAGEREDYNGQSDASSMLSFDQGLPTPYASPSEEPSLLQHFGSSKQAMHSAHSQLQSES